jgi:hypothetical protein
MTCAHTHAYALAVSMQLLHTHDRRSALVGSSQVETALAEQGPDILHNQLEPRSDQGLCSMISASLNMSEVGQRCIGCGHTPLASHAVQLL